MMSNIHFQIKAQQRGSSAEHAKYITRQGRYWFGGDLIATGYGNMPSWAIDCPERFWRAADRYERANSAPNREYVIALPDILDSGQNIQLSMCIIESLIGNKPYQYAVHAPEGKIGGMPNPHLHVMFSDRLPDGIERPPAKMFSRYNAKDPKQGGCKKDSGGRNAMQLRDDVIAKRGKVAAVINEAVKSAGHEERVDHRSNKERGIKREPEKHLGPVRVDQMSAAEKEALRSRRAAGEAEMASKASPRLPQTDDDDDKRLHDARLPRMFG